jgi:hypothetical protein
LGGGVLLIFFRDRELQGESGSSSRPFAKGC